MSASVPEKTEFDFDHAGELAHRLESMPLTERAELWQNLNAEERGEVMPFLHEDIKESLLEASSVRELQDLAETMDAGDIVEVIELLPDELAQEVFDSLSEQAKEEVDETLSFTENTVGRLLRRDAMRIAPARSVQKALDFIKANGLPKYSDKLFLVGRNNRYLGAVALADVLQADAETPLRELPKFENESVFTADTSLAEMTQQFRFSNFTSAAVVNADGTFLGRITAEDAVSNLRDEADHQILGMAGLDEDNDLFAPVMKSARQRAVWLGINLLTAFLASYVIGLFEATVQQLVALAVLMPVVASMGGIAGSQTLTIVIRGLALDQLNSSNTKALLGKELGVGFLNGLLWAVVVGLVSYLWFGNPILGAVIAAAIFINLCAAAIAGLFIPVILDRLNIDPALSGSVVLTTVTDVVGFMSFLGLATLLIV